MMPAQADRRPISDLRERDINRSTFAFVLAKFL
jgi:hypothetical protein